MEVTRESQNTEGDALCTEKEESQRHVKTRHQTDSGRLGSFRKAKADALNATQP